MLIAGYLAGDVPSAICVIEIPFDLPYLSAVTDSESSASADPLMILIGLCFAELYDLQAEALAP